MERRPSNTPALIALLVFSSTLPTGAAQGGYQPPAGAASVPPPRTASEWPDVHSYADPEAFVTRHFELDLEADFDDRELRGSATLWVEQLAPDATELVLDTRDLAIIEVEVSNEDGAFAPAKYRLDARHEVLGSALRIAMPPAATRVRIGYSTSPQASGLQWLLPSQTLGKRLPFLYSQAQSIHARSFVPLQDTPRIRATYSATLRVPRGFTAVMAAAADPGNPVPGARRPASEPAGSGTSVAFRFEMPQPIPSYLLALAIGELRFAATGPRTGVWAEPDMLEAAASEFEDAGEMLVRTEALYGPYRWDRYDVLVLPPSFPYGGMENPRLTFMTPTVVAGDKSLIGVLAHELAHSWSGNLVTNATWRDGWLNEGFTTYFERRIMEEIYGSERAAMEWGIGEGDLRRGLAELKPSEAWRRSLAPDLSEHIGEEGAAVSFEQGALFLRQLEDRYGRAVLDRFLERWCAEHAFTSVTTPEFVDYLRRELIEANPGKVDSGFVARWIEGEDIPDDAVFVRSDRFTRVDAVRENWERGEVETAELADAGWGALEWLHFLNGVSRPQRSARLADLDDRFRFTGSSNAEIAHAWYRLAIASNYAKAYPAIERYLLGIGRLKLIRPLYMDLLKTPEGKQFALRVYAAARPGYHPITQRALDKEMPSRS
jgi:leukotriene-A4 hydrolase